MSTYLVLKVMTSEDGKHYPNELLVDPDNAGILMERGFIVPVPDSFTPPGVAKTTKAAKPEPKTSRAPKEAPTTATTTEPTEPLPTVEDFLEAGYSQEAAEALAKGEGSELANNETKLLEEAADKRPNAVALSKKLDASVAEVMGLSDEDYSEAVKALGEAEAGA